MPVGVDALGFCRLPPFDCRGIVAEHLEPCHRVSETGPVGQAFGHPGRQGGVGQTRKRLHDLPHSVDIFSRHGQRAKDHAFFWPRDLTPV
jgi:hypothetical protein